MKGWVMLVVGIGIGVLATTLMGPRLCRFWAIDECLDRGGTWDYGRGVCEGIRPK